MIELFAFLGASSVFIITAMLVADVLLSRWAARQDVVWRVTLVAICILPCVLLLRPWLSTGALAIGVALSADQFEFTESRTAIIVAPLTHSTLPTTTAQTTDESGVMTFVTVSSSAEFQSSADSSLQPSATATESAPDIAHYQASTNVSVIPRIANGIDRIAIAALWITPLWIAGTLYQVVVTCGGCWRLRRQTQAAVPEADGRWQTAAGRNSRTSFLHAIPVCRCRFGSVRTHRLQQSVDFCATSF